MCCNSSPLDDRKDLLKRHLSQLDSEHFTPINFVLVSTFYPFSFVCWLGFRVSTERNVFSVVIHELFVFHKFTIRQVPPDTKRLNGSFSLRFLFVIASFGDQIDQQLKSKSIGREIIPKCVFYLNSYHADFDIFFIFPFKGCKVCSRCQGVALKNLL